MPTSSQYTLNLSASGNSEKIGIQNRDNVCVQLEWSGDPVGSFSIEVSLDGVSFFPLSIDPVSAGGVSGAWLFDLSLLSMQWLRIAYIRTSGTGSAIIMLGGKKV